MKYLFILLFISPLSAVTLPHTFTNGQVADADQMNLNLVTLADAINSSNSQTTFTVTGSTNLSGLIYPLSDGNNGEILSTDGMGILSWVQIPATLSPSDNVNITGDWDNSAHPWSDAEVSANLTIIGGSISNTPISGATGDFTSAVISEQLDIQGGSKHSFMNVSANGSISTNVMFTYVDTTAQTIRLDLPLASSAPGQVVRVVKTAKANELEIFAANGGNINSGNMIKMQSSFAHAELMSNGSLWYLLSQKGASFVSSYLNEYSVLFTGGATESIDVTNITNTNLMQRSSQFSVSIWVKTTSAISQTLWSSQDSSYVGHILEMQSDGRLWLDMDGYGGAFSASTGLNDGLWHNIILTYDGTENSTSFIYLIDGVQESNTESAIFALNNSITAVSTSIKFGKASVFNAQSFDGLMDEIAFYDKVINATEASDIYNSGIPQDLTLLDSNSNLKGYWRCGEGDTLPTFTDNSGNGNDATLTAATQSMIVP